ncbi:MAG: hypothetical protein ACRDNZ_08780, partial [Streptosporangiaceae bacterium]
TLAGWVVIDMDATVVTARSDKEGRLPPGRRAGSRPVPGKILVPIDGAGASHDLIKHLLSLSSPRRAPLFTRGWMITPADEQAIALLPAGAWKPGITQDAAIEQDKDVAEITCLMTRAGNWPDGLRWIVQRVKPSRRQVRNLTDDEKKTGWRHSITRANIPGSGIGGVPGSHHPQHIDVTYREHACVQTAGVRTAKAMGLRGLPPKTWQVNAGWVITANIAADLAAWTRLLGHHDDPRAAGSQPGHAPLPGLAPARPPRPPRPAADPRDQPRLAMGRCPHLLAAPPRPDRTSLASTNHPHDPEGGHPGTVGAGAHPGTPGSTPCHHTGPKQTK